MKAGKTRLSDVLRCNAVRKSKERRTGACVFRRLLPYARPVNGVLKRNIRYCLPVNGDRHNICGTSLLFVTLI